MYAEVFDNAGALDQLEGFASFHGPAFYGLPRNTGTITLRRESWTPPDSFAFGEAELKPCARAKRCRGSWYERGRDGRLPNCIAD